MNKLLELAKNSSMVEFLLNGLTDTSQEAKTFKEQARIYLETLNKRYTQEVENGK